VLLAVNVSLTADGNAEKYERACQPALAEGIQAFAFYSYFLFSK
jgi:hypothetical protein